jgi:mannitol/fructose-specific phosphotransferase system IIA component (Ntr-type)
MGETPAADGIALPHLRLEGIQRYELMIARSRRGLHFPGIGRPVHAVFVLLGLLEDPQQHLRMLAGIARRADGPDFLERWVGARDAGQLRMMLLAGEDSAARLSSPKSLTKPGGSGK